MTKLSSFKGVRFTRLFRFQYKYLYVVFSISQSKLFSERFTCIYLHVKAENVKIYLGFNFVVNIAFAFSN